MSDIETLFSRNAFTLYRNNDFSGIWFMNPDTDSMNCRHFYHLKVDLNMNRIHVYAKDFRRFFLNSIEYKKHLLILCSLNKSAQFYVSKKRWK